MPEKRSLRQAAREGATKSPAKPVEPKQVTDLLEHVRMTQGGGNQPAKPPPCEKCVRRAEHDKRETMERQAANERRKAKAAARAGKPKRNPLEDNGRLPDGSVIEATYDAATQTWSGRLIVGRGEGHQITYTGSASGIEGLCRKLGMQHFAAVAAAKESATAAEKHLDTAPTPR